MANGMTIPLKFQVQPTQAQLDAIEASYTVQHQYDSVNQEIVSIYDHIDLLKDFIAKIKATPTVTLTQYNTWLATKQWWEAATIRFFVFKLATLLANSKGLTLSNYTETEVLGKLRDWIVAKPSKEIAKVVLGQLNL